jgi:IS6 family transposase
MPITAARPFKGRQYSGEVILTAVRWYLRYPLAYEHVASNNPMPRVINVDKNPAYPAAIRALKREGTLPRRVRLRQRKYLNNIIEQDHRVVKKRTWLAKGYGSFRNAWRTLEGIETVNMIRKGRVRWVAKDDVSAQARFVANLFGIAA